MGQVNVLYDSNILIDQLGGAQQAIDKLKNSIDPHISVITWIEVLAGAKSAEEERKLRRMLGNFTVIPLAQAIAERTAALRRERTRLKLPEALILATAQVGDRTLVTRNTRDFTATDPGIRVPYTL